VGHVPPAVEGRSLPPGPDAHTACFQILSPHISVKDILEAEWGWQIDQVRRGHQRLVEPTNYLPRPGAERHPR